MRFGLKEIVILTVFAVGLAVADARGRHSAPRCAACELDAMLRANREVALPRSTSPPPAKNHSKPAAPAEFHDEALFHP